MSCQGKHTGDRLKYFLGIVARDPEPVFWVFSHVNLSLLASATSSHGGETRALFYCQMVPRSI